MSTERAASAPPSPAPPTGDDASAATFDALWALCEAERGYSQIVAEVRAGEAQVAHRTGEIARADTLQRIAIDHRRRAGQFAALGKLVRRIEHAPDIRARLREIAAAEHAAREREKAERQARLNAPVHATDTDHDTTNGDA